MFWRSFYRIRRPPLPAHDTPRPMTRFTSRLFTLVTPLMVSLAPSVNAQPPADWNAFTGDFRTYVAKDGIVGASVLVMKDGKVTGRLDLGARDQQAKLPVTENTIYHWGSITKSLTAIAIMQLRDRGKLSLDDRITRYVPELRQLHDPFGMIDSITIRMLLSHSGGFRNGTWPYGNGKPWEPFEPTTWNQLVAMMPYQELLYKPGTRYSYSNPAFVYLGRVIEQLSGDPWDAYIQKNIFAPLGMQHSYFRGTPYYLAADRSHNYSIVRDSTTKGGRTVDNGADFDPGITTPNGGWNAPLGDLARYVAFLTDRAPVDGSKANYATVLSRASLAEMWKPVVPMTDGYEAAADQHMGFSFFLRGTGEHRVIGHTGSQAGFRSFYYFNPTTSVGVIAVFNTTNELGVAASEFRGLSERAIALVR